MARRSGLGKGLSALIPADPKLSLIRTENPDDPGGGAGADGAAPAGSAFAELPVASVVANRHQPRRDFDEESLALLAVSIREVGVLQPILVRPGGEEGTYELIAGERRWRAARRVGLDRIPAIVRQVGEQASVEQAVVENLHRTDLNPLEEAAAYQQLVEEFGMTHEQVATRVGRSRAAISNGLRLLALPAGIQKLLADGAITGGHAKALLGTPDRAYQEHLAHRTVEEHLTVRQVEEAVRERAILDGRQPEGEGDDGGVGGGATGVTGVGARRVGRRPRDPGMLELEELLAGFLDTRVHIQGGAKGRGKLVVEFADVEDLERIYRTIASGPDDLTS